jgi:hypothetical protein
MGETINRPCSEGVPVGGTMTDMPMIEDEQWFLSHGFRIEVETEVPGIFWTHLVAQEKQTAIGRLPRYGHGATPDDSIKDARLRYEVEQLGTEPSSWQ